ncbi:MAG: glycosyltransferase family 39 protein, partial [Acidobacteriota bacterium]|nr:glycosyltransferase family 39 protein [Acidobacteriota bacterium]
CFVIAVCFLFAATRRVFGITSAAFTAAVLFLLNPNALYLQSTAMTEPVFFACLCGLLYATAAFQETRSPKFVFLAGICAAAGTLTRYEGWFLLPFTAIFFLMAAREHRFRAASVFLVLAGAGPALWLAYNWWVFDNPLEFFNGPGSPAAIQGNHPYPGLHDWRLAIIYYGTAARLNLGNPLFWGGFVCVAACLVHLRRTAWPLLLLALPPIFYLWSMHSTAAPIFVPPLMNSWYNTRYGLALLPFAAFSCAGLIALIPASSRGMASLLVVAVCAGQWLLFPRPESWITWKESQINSEARRAWTSQAVQYLALHYKPGQTIYSTAGDTMGIYRRMGIPFRRILTVDNGPLFNAVTVRPDLFLWTRWVVCFAGDETQTAVDRARLNGPDYQLQREIFVPGAPVLQIYRRSPKAFDLLP